MHSAALAALGMGDGGATRRSTSRRSSSRTRVRAMAGEGFAGANVTVPHKGAALALADELLRDRARDRRRQHAGLRGRRDPRRQHRRRRPAERAARPRRSGNARWCSAPAARPEPSSGPCCVRAPTVARLEPHRAALASPLRGVGRRAGLRPEPGGLRADRQLDRCGPGRRGARSRSCRWIRLASRLSRPWSTWSTAESQPPCYEPQRVAEPTTVDGLEILVQQGALSLEIWTGRKPPLDTMRAAART